MKPLTKTVARRTGGLAAMLELSTRPVSPKRGSSPQAEVPAGTEAHGSRETQALQPAYIKWREANPDLYRERQRDYMRKRRAKEREKRK